MKENEHKSILELIYDWSLDRADWQRDAIRRVIQQVSITDSDFDELYNLLKNEVYQVDGAKLFKPLMLEHLPQLSRSSIPITLKSIKDIENLNQLVNGDSALEFAKTGLTVIYGDNGTGKSGYTRILKNVCRARHRESEILPNIYDDNCANNPKATIVYTDDANNDIEYDWEYSPNPDPILSNISIFDRKCGGVHLNNGNEIAYSPFGLDVPDKLARVCKELELRFKNKLSELDKNGATTFNNLPWDNSTNVYSIIKGLTGDCDIEAINNIAEMTQVELNREKELKEFLEKDPAIALKELKHKLCVLTRLSKFLNELERAFKDEEVVKLKKLQDGASNKRTQADNIAKVKLSSSLLPGVAETIWKKMWAAAKQYSDEVVYPRSKFPELAEESKCVLCQQELSEAALASLKEFERIIKDTSEQEAQLEEEKFETKKENLLDLCGAAAYSTILREVKLVSYSLYKKSRRFIASVRLRRFIIKKNFENQIFETVIPPLFIFPFSELRKKIAGIQDLIQKTEQFPDREKKEGLMQEMKELTARIELGKHLDMVENEIKRLKDISLINKCILSTKTNSITILGNKLADASITNQYRDKFSKEIISLVNNRVRVDVQRSGGSYGSPEYKVALFAAPKVNVRKVLSEGEQTCVALASFLSEIDITENKSAIVFDDPVNSLDHLWRSNVASRLILEAKKRQVVIFTHDLVFLNELQDMADAHSVSFSGSKLDRFSDSVGYVSNSLPWDGMGIKQKIDELEKQARELRRQRDENAILDGDYKDETRKFFSNLREAWEKAFEQVALGNTIIRFRSYINPKNMEKLCSFDREVHDSWQKGYKECCTYLKGHDTPSAIGSSMSDSSELLDKVNLLGTWVQSLKSKQ